MSNTAEKITELTIAERVSQALSVDYTENQLKALAKKNADVTEIKDDNDYELVKRAGIELQKVRVSIEKSGKAARDDANRFAKAIITEERRLTGIITPEEDRLKALRKEVDDAKARKAEEARLVEMARIQNITDKISSIKQLADGLLGANSTTIRHALEKVREIDCTEETFNEFTEKAARIKKEVFSQLEQALKVRETFEKQRTEQERIAKIQAEQQARLDRQAEAQRKKEEEARAKLEAEQAEIRRQQEAIEAKKRADEAKRLAAERAESDRIRKEKEALEAEKRKREAEELRIAEEKAEAERQAALRPEKDKLREWAASLRFIECPNLKDKKLQEIAQKAMHSVNDIGTELISTIDNSK